VEPQELQGSRQPPRDVAGRRLVLQEKVSDNTAGSDINLLFSFIIPFSFLWNLADLVW
jgi:hypothetical protein